jgi:phage FluMu protein Com
VATVTQTQIRCAGCNRRLADLVNELEAGQVLVELKCPRCGQPHVEVIRPHSNRGIESRYDASAVTGVSRIS